MAVSVAPRASLLPVFLMLMAGPLPGAPDSRGVRQSPLYAVTPEGGSVNITCSASESVLGLFLKQNWSEDANVIYYDGARDPTVDPKFSGRINFSGPHHNLTITVRRLRPADTGVYICQAIMESKKDWGIGTLVVVTDAGSQAANACQDTRKMHFVLPVALATAFVLVELGLLTMCALRVQNKKRCWPRDQSSACVVYEDMSHSRRNTMSTPNYYK